MAQSAPPSSAPSANDPIVRAAAQVIGGPLGRYARLPTRRWSGRGPRRGRPVWPWALGTAWLVMAAAVLVALGVVQKGYCFSHGWGGSDVFWHACFSDLPHLYVSSPLASGALPYGPDALGQPVGTGLAMWAVGAFVPDGPGAAALFVAAWALFTVVLAAVLVVIIARCCPSQPWRAAQVALCPLLLTSALVAPDLFGVVLVAVGLWQWSRDRPVLAGLVFGAAIASRTYALVVLLALGLVALRAGALRVWARTAGCALLMWAVLLGGVGALAGSGVATPYLSWLGASAEYGSPWFLPTLAGAPLSAAVSTVAAVSGWVVALLLGVLTALVPRHRPNVAEVALVMVVAVMVLGKALPVQASLWLIPLVALAGVRWRDYLIWVGAEVVYFVTIWLYLGGLSDPERALPGTWFAVFTSLRLAAICWLGWCAFRQATGRAAVTAAVGGVAVDPALKEAGGLDGTGEDDDLAGPLSGADDALVVSLR